MIQRVLVEKVFAWPGIGSLLVDSVLQRDVPAVQGSIFVIVLFFLTLLARVSRRRAGQLSALRETAVRNEQVVAMGSIAAAARW